MKIKKLKKHSIYNYDSDNKLHGYCKSCNETTGELYSEGYFHHGKFIGDWKWFHSNGNVKCEGTHKMGEEIGLWFWYYPDGRVKIKNYYII